MLRLRQLRQPHQRPGGHPGHERIPNWDEALEGSTEEAQGCVKALLRRTCFKNPQKLPPVLESNLRVNVINKGNQARDFEEERCNLILTVLQPAEAKMISKLYEC